MWNREVVAGDVGVGTLALQPARLHGFYPTVPRSLFLGKSLSDTYKRIPYLSLFIVLNVAI